MRLSEDTITIFNEHIDDYLGYSSYIPTVISGVSWYSHVDSVVTDAGLKAANKFTIRIPVDADFGGKEYADPVSYTSADPASAFTLRSGDFIIKGAETEPMKPDAAREKYGEIVTILGVTDNRRARREKHWKVVGS